MKSDRTYFECSECGRRESKWFGNVDVLKMTRALEEVLKLLKQLVERWR